MATSQVHVSRLLRLGLDLADKAEIDGVSTEIVNKKDHADANMGVLRRASLSLSKNEDSKKVGIKNKRLIAAWNIDYLQQVLFGI
jgi:hypothetical protein